MTKKNEGKEREAKDEKDNEKEKNEGRKLQEAPTEVGNGEKIFLEFK